MFAKICHTNAGFRVAYYVPLYSLTNLFIYILTDPKLDSVKSDLVLIEVGLGYFARLDFDTESYYVSTPFIKDLSQLARRAIETAKVHVSQQDGLRSCVNEQEPLPESSLQIPELGTEQPQIDGGSNDEVRDIFLYWRIKFIGYQN